MRSARKNRHAELSGRLEPRPESDLIPVVEAAENPLVLILDCIKDPHNLGACLRTADAAGVDAVIAPKDKSARLNDTVRSVACGGAESVPFFAVTNLARTMRSLKDAGVWLVGTADTATQLLYEVDLKGPIGIVLGSEEDGMRRLTTENCDFLVKIPMNGRKVPCLNVSVAAGVSLFETVRQRTSG